MKKSGKWQSLWYSQQVPFHTEIADLSDKSVQGRFQGGLSGSAVRIHFANRGDTGPQEIRRAVLI